MLNGEEGAKVNSPGRYILMICLQPLQILKVEKVISIIITDYEKLLFYFNRQMRLHYLD